MDDEINTLGWYALVALHRVVRQENTIHRGDLRPYRSPCERWSGPVVRGVGDRGRGTRYAGRQSPREDRADGDY